MRKNLAVLLAAMSVVLSGCGAMSRSSATEMKSSDADARNRWTATLVTPSTLAGAMQVRGVASWASDGNGSKATISISNATAGGVHPWHVHQGRCGDNGPVVGNPGAYKALTVGGDGQASENASLSVPLPGSGDYSVNVHAQTSNMGTIISCGNLAPPVQ